MAYALLDVEVLAPMPAVQPRPDQDRVGLVVRRRGRPVVSCWRYWPPAPASNRTRWTSWPAPPAPWHSSGRRSSTSWGGTRRRAHTPSPSPCARGTVPTCSCAACTASRRPSTGPDCPGPTSSSWTTHRRRQDTRRRRRTTWRALRRGAAGGTRLRAQPRPPNRPRRRRGLPRRRRRRGRAGTPPCPRCGPCTPMPEGSPARCCRSSSRHPRRSPSSSTAASAGPGRRPGTPDRSWPATPSTRTAPACSGRAAT